MSDSYDSSLDSLKYWEAREQKLRESIEGVKAPTPTTAELAPSVLVYPKSGMEKRAEELFQIGADCLSKIKADPQQTRNIVTASRDQLAAKVKQISQTATGGDKRDRLELADHVDAFLGVAYDFGGFDPILIGALANVERAAETL